MDRQQPSQQPNNSSGSRQPATTAAANLRAALAAQQTGIGMDPNAILLALQQQQQQQQHHRLGSPLGGSQTVLAQTADGGLVALVVPQGADTQQLLQHPQLSAWGGAAPVQLLTGLDQLQFGAGGGLSLNSQLAASLALQQQQQQAQAQAEAFRINQSRALLDQQVRQRQVAAGSIEGGTADDSAARRKRKAAEQVIDLCETDDDEEEEEEKPENKTQKEDIPKRRYSNKNDSNLQRMVKDAIEKHKGDDKHRDHPSHGKKKDSDHKHKHKEKPKPKDQQKEKEHGPSTKRSRASYSKALKNLVATAGLKESKHKESTPEDRKTKGASHNERSTKEKGFAVPDSTNVPTHDEQNAKAKGSIPGSPQVAQGVDASLGVPNPLVQEVMEEKQTTSQSRTPVYDRDSKISYIVRLLISQTVPAAKLQYLTIMPDEMAEVSKRIRGVFQELVSRRVQQKPPAENHRILAYEREKSIQSLRNSIAAQQHKMKEQQKTIDRLTRQHALNNVYPALVKKQTDEITYLQNQINVTRRHNAHSEQTPELTAEIERLHLTLSKLKAELLQERTRGEVGIRAYMMASVRALESLREDHEEDSSIRSAKSNASGIE